MNSRVENEKNVEKLKVHPSLTQGIVIAGAGLLAAVWSWARSPMLGTVGSSSSQNQMETKKYRVNHGAGSRSKSQVRTEEDIRMEGQMKRQQLSEACLGEGKCWGWGLWAWPSNPPFPSVYIWGTLLCQSQGIKFIQTALITQNSFQMFPSVITSWSKGKTKKRNRTKSSYFIQRDIYQ